VHSPTSRSQLIRLIKTALVEGMKCRDLARVGRKSAVALLTIRRHHGHIAPVTPPSEEIVGVGHLAIARVPRLELGAYASNSEVIREAVRGWIERERHFAALEASMDRGIAAAEASEVKTSDQVSSALLARLGVEDAPKS
jgi:putative addiction module CopG family antidote